MVIAGQGSTLLVIPGIQGRWEWARPAIKELARRHRVVSYSLSGERNTVPPVAARSFDDLVRQAINALNRATDGPAVVCGVSYGGLIAVRLAARHPERVRGLVLASPLNADFAPDDRMRRWVAHPRLMAPGFLAGSPRRIVPELRAAHGRTWVPCALDLLGRVVRAPHSPDRMAERIAGAVHECAAASRLAQGVGADDPHAPGTERAEPLAEALEALERTLHRLATQPPLFVEPGCEPDRLTQAVDDDELPVRMTGHDHVKTVGAEVDGRQDVGDPVGQGRDALRP